MRAIFSPTFWHRRDNGPQGRTRSQRAPVARRGCQCRRNNKPRRGGGDVRSRRRGGLSPGGNRGWQANPPKAAGSTKSLGRRAGRRHGDRPNRQTSLFPRRGARLAARFAGDHFMKRSSTPGQCTPGSMKERWSLRFPPARMAGAPCACAAKACLVRMAPPAICW